MIFNSFSFIIFFPLIFLFYYLIPVNHPKIRNGFLFTISYLLYIKWEPAFAFILFGVTFVTYSTARLLDGVKNRKSLVLVGLGASFIPLIFFKYINFICESLMEMIPCIGFQIQLPGLNLAIPLGISFFTFQAVGYLMDVYYQRVPAEKDFLTYALFVSFFPSIVAGPINKASLVIPQLKSIRPYFIYSKAVEGLKMILWGMFMKVVVADRLAIYVNQVLPDYIHYTGTTLFLASLFYTIQIYTDFAGYSLMAIGVGKTLGFELTENFRRPYFAVSVTDFWRRWHISLSTWLKDYIYIPMGGSRCSKLRNYWNIFVTFFVSGIWHGANWTFIVWGCMHGVCQIVEKMLNQQKCDYGWLGKTVKILTTFLLVNFAWIFFRMPTLSDACGVIMRIFDFSIPMTIFLPAKTEIVLYLMGFGMVFIKDFLDEYYPGRFCLLSNSCSFVRWFSYLSIIILIMLTGVFSSDQFIYVNF